MEGSVCSRAIAAFLFQSLLFAIAHSSTAAVSAREAGESRVLVSLLGTTGTQSGTQSEDWGIDSDDIQAQVTGSEILSSPPEILFVCDAARLTDADYQRARTWMGQTLNTLEQDRQIAWVDDQGWQWTSTSLLPSKLPEYSKKQEDGFEAAVFFDWLREIVTERSDGGALQLVVLTRDFPVSLPSPAFDSSSEAGESLPSQCLNTLVSVLTDRLVRLHVINFAPNSGHLTRLAEVTGGSVFEGITVDSPLSSPGEESFFLLTLQISFRESEQGLPLLPVQPVRIHIRNRESEPEVSAPQLLWPLPTDLRPPALSGLLEAQQLRPRADTLAQEGDRIQALVLARRIVRLSPFDLSDRVRTLRLLRSIGNPDPGELERSIDEALQLFPDSIELCYQKGLVAEEEGRTKEAITWYQEALRSGSHQQHLHIQLAQLFMKEGQWDLSIEHFEKVLGTELDSPAVRINLASAFRALGLSERAREQAEVVRKMKPGSLPLAELEMSLALDSAQYNEALEMALQAVKVQPKQPTANLTAGLALTRLQRYEEAVPYLRTAEAAHLRDAYPLQFGLYECFRAQGLLDEAAAHLEKAATLRPRSPGVWMRLALLHEERGDQQGAGEALKRGAEQNADNLDFQLSLVEWNERQGNRSEAMEQLEKAMAMTRGQEHSAIAQRYVLLALRDTGASGVLESVKVKLDPQLNQELLRGIDSCLEAQREERPQKEALSGIILPGGLEPLLNYAPFLKSRLQGEDLLDLLFGYLLETEPLEFANQKVVQSNSRREEAVTFLREFVRFKKWLYREAGTDRISQPITTEESDLEAANQILNYFGVKVQRFRFSRPTYTPDPDSVPKLEVIVEPRYERRRTVLKWYGISTNLIGEGSVLEIGLEEAKLPVLMGMSFWNRNFLKTDSEEELLLEWLKKPQVMKLYRALIRLPAPARDHFVRTLKADQLLEEISPGLLSMGTLLDFDAEGRLILPGGEGAARLWSQLVQTSPDDEQSFLRNLFTQEQGKPLYYLASLSGQRPEVLALLTSDPRKFREYYQLLTPPPKGNFLAGRPARNFHDMADLLSMLRTDGNQVFFPAAWTGPSPSSDPNTLLFAGDNELIGSLFGTAENGTTTEAARKYAILESLRYRQTPLVSGAPERLLNLGALYWPVVELGLDSAQTDTLLNQIDFIEANISKSERRSVVALFQAPFVLLRILVANHVLEKKEISPLVDMLLSKDSWDPGDLAIKVSSVLLQMVRLLEEESGAGSPLEVLLKAFAERHKPISYIWEGKVLRMDLTAREIEQMLTSLEDHFVPPLDNVVGALDQLAPASQDPAIVVQKVTSLVQPLLMADDSLDYLSDQYREAIEHTSAEGLQAALDKFQREFPGLDEEGKRQVSRELANELAPYLVDALIALVYVRSIKENDLVVQTDEHFFRKHAFEERAFTLGSHGPQAMGGSWGQPILVKDRLLGSQIVGSLAGLSRPLARLKAEQLRAHSATRFADSTYPVTQKLAVELVDPLHLTNETLACVGRTIDLARKILAASLLDRKLRAFALSEIGRLTGSLRSSRIRQSIEDGDLAAALDLLLPSELYQLGKDYWTRQSGNSQPDKPIETDLSWFFQKNQGCTASFTQRETSPANELGFPMATSLGVDLLALGDFGPIEGAATFNSPHRAAERSCELKLHMAELFWRMGLPSPLFKLVCDKILDQVLPQVGQVDREDWKAVTQHLQTVDREDIESVLAQLLNE